MASPLIRKSTTAAILAMSLAVTCVAQNFVVTLIQKKKADWNDASSWVDGVMPSQDNEMAIINGGRSAILDSPFEAPIHVQVGNGISEAPDGALTINADFRVKDLAVAVAEGTSGRVEQSAGAVSVEQLSLASISAEALGATYDLIGGKMNTETLKMGVSGPATLNLTGSGEVVTVQSRLLAASQSALHFTGDKVGFPTLNAAAADITIEPGATLTVESAGPGTKPGKFPLVLAGQPLATSFKVNLVGFGEGKAKLLESEPGIVLEVK
jgi:hypothetical protein